MDGYSVKDAAVVLGIPERRVWELLARGVLAGAPEGPDGMIVYLQPRGTAPSVATSQAAAGPASESSGARTNGNGGSHELSPFRELLTEFRNLTERYGQALLALGEARGEVAALRGRVELLEARMDLRLPSTPPTSTVAWEMPEFSVEDELAPPGFEAEMSVVDDAALPEFDEAVAGEDEPAAEPMIDLFEEAIIAEELLAEVEPIAKPDLDELAAIDARADEPALGDVPPEGDAPEEEGSEAVAVVPEAPRRRSRGSRTATAAFAAALARADDPTIAELPGAEETAAALAALQRDIDASRAAEPPMDTEAVATESSEATTEPEAIAEPEDEAESAMGADAAALAATDPAPAPEPPAEAETAEPPEASVPSYYSTDVVEPDWFADGDFSWLEAAQAEAMRVEAERSRAREAPADPAADVVGATVEEEPAESGGEPQEAVGQEPAAEEPAAEEPAAGESAAQAEVPDPEPEPAMPSDEPNDEGGDLRAVPIEMSDESTAVPADVAFGEHPDTQAVAPDVVHDQFAPTVESQAMAEEKARSAIQDAFEESPGGHQEESSLASGTTVAVATAVAEREPELEVEAAEDMADDLADEAPAAAGEPEAEAIQEAFEPVEDTAGEPVHAESDGEHEVEVEADALQEAFEEPMPAPDWSASEPESTPPVVEPPTLEDAPSATDESPMATAAAAAATFRGPEEFIAPSAPPAPVRLPADTPSSTGNQPAPTPGEEPLMWLGEEFEAADLEVAAQGWRSPDATPAVQAGPAPVLELSDAELAQLAEDEGWDADEVEAIRRLLGRQSDAPPPEPFPPAAPARDADPEGAPSPGEQAGSLSGGSAAPPAGTASQRGFADAGGPPQSWSPRPPGSASGAGTDESIDSDWLQGRSGAAADAYRRLRKLFPN